MRRIVSLAVGSMLVLAGATALAGPAAATSPTGSTYVALSTPFRVVDTRNGAAQNHKGAVAGGHGITPTIGGKGGVPTTATSVAVTISAVSPTANGGIEGYVGTRPTATNLQFTKGRSASDTAILQLASGRVNLFNGASSGTVQIVVDVSGYYVPADADGPGVFHDVTPKRAVDTTTGAGGNHHGALAAGTGMTPTFNTGNSNVPSSAGAVAVTITVLNVQKAGSIIANRPDEPRQSLALLHFVPGQRASAFAVLRVSGNQVDIVNTSGGSVDVVIDVAGYYGIGFPQAANAFQTVVQTRVRSGGSVAPNADLNFPLAGKGGVPLSGVAAALVTLHVVGPTRSGGLQAYRQGSTRNGTVLQFVAGQTTSNVVFAPVSTGGAIAIHNSSSGSVSVYIDVDGYVPTTTVPNPSTATKARYVRNITDTPIVDTTSPNYAPMHSEGQADAGQSFVLLHIGAQANNKMGVSLSAIDRFISYDNLVFALNTYLDAYISGGGHGTVAIATNNSGDFSDAVYSPTARGTDWFSRVVDKLHVPPGGRVVGAADFEAGFTSTAEEATTWKSKFLLARRTAHPGISGVGLVYTGSADFCPKTWTTGSACNFGWDYHTLYALAGGTETEVLPQIYFGYMATEWAEIDRTGGGHLNFLGSLTHHAQAPGSLAPEQGHTALVRAVSSATTTAVGSLAVDIDADS